MSGAPSAAACAKIASHSHHDHISARDSLNLPAALDALDRPIGLPPSLVKKAEEVRLESGPERIDTYIRDVQALAQHVSSLLDEVRAIRAHRRTIHPLINDLAGHGHP